MPLFGHKKHAAERDQLNNQNPTTGVGAGTTTNPQHGTTTSAQHGPTGASGGYDQQNAPGLQSNNTAGYGGQTGMPNQGYGAGGAEPYSSRPTGTSNDPNMSPTSHFSSGQHSGGGSRVAGKVEHAIGALVGSQALKSKGIQKEQEAESYKVQSTEIAEAERLEKEAMLRRERAVQHGAHPSNLHPGGATGTQEYGNNFGDGGNTGVGGPQGHSGGQRY